ncbi:OmpH family outer membrane protein [Alteromonas sediminis]|uniref:OmpH family outer membrane protein n=1 Tax=Alteromonas sediminis TaxID=2259342 RepID=A0A3N5Y3B2_9ALTE|nr:OmpH family outer membrane protein [Alteromonas sediminis]RPJ68372.1 OmpH family outer membrane protein [Alteromonas sediminis]
MKYVTKSLIATAMLGASLVSAPVLAEQKIAIIDVQGVFQAMPQAAEINAKIQSEFKTQIDEINQLQKDGQFYAERLQRDAATMSDSEKEDLQQKILDVRQQLAEKGQPLQQNIQRRTQEERNVLLGIIKNAIDSVAASQNYDLVLDAGAASFAKPEFDISQKVLDEINKAN